MKYMFSLPAGRSVLGTVPGVFGMVRGRRSWVVRTQDLRDNFSQFGPTKGDKNVSFDFYKTHSIQIW